MTGIVLLPLSSKADAVKAIEATKAKLKKQAAEDNADAESDISGDEEATQNAPSPTEVDASSDRGDTASAAAPKDEPTQASVAEDVIKKKGNFGRFAAGWFSKKGWSSGRAAAQGVSTDKAREDERVTDSARPTLAAKEASRSLSLLPKLLRTTETLFCSQNMYFSYDWDLTRRIGTQVKGSDLPLHKACDSLVCQLETMPTCYSLTACEVLLEPQAVYPTDSCWTASLRPSAGARLCRPTSLYRQYQVE